MGVKMEKKKNIINYVITAALFLIFVVFTILVKTVDVQPVGPNDSQVGFASMNSAFFNLAGSNDKWYNLSEVLGYVAIAVAVCFAVVGFVQALKRKSVKLVDYEILLLGGFYVVVVAFYLIFELVDINFRPVLIDGELEASYPSSHTMLTLCILSTARIPLNKLIKHKSLNIVLEITAIFIMILTIVARMLSGVHWLSDIIGGILLSAALIMLYYSAVEHCKSMKDKAAQTSISE